MKAVFSLMVLGMLMTSTSNAFCLKQFSASENRFVASQKTKAPAGQVRSNKVNASTVQPGAARK